MLDDDYILSGSRDKTIKLWKLSTASCIETFNDHEGEVWSLAKITNNKFLSVSQDCTIKLWTLKAESD